MSDSEESKPAVPINVSVKIGEKGEPVFFKLKRTAKLGKIFANFNKINRVQDGTYTFSFDGHRLNDDETLAENGLNEGDVILASLHHEGGAQTS